MTTLQAPGSPSSACPRPSTRRPSPPALITRSARAKAGRRLAPAAPPSPLWAHPTTPNIPPLGGAIQAHKRAGEKVCSLVGQVSS